MKSGSFEEENKTIVELRPEEISIYDSEKKEKMISLKTIISGNNDCGKSTLICALLEKEIDLRPLEQREETKLHGEKTFFLSDWAYKLSLTELNPNKSLNNCNYLDKTNTIIIMVNDKEFDSQLREREEDLRRMEKNIAFKNQKFGSKLFILFINNMQEGGKLNLTKDNPNFDGEYWHCLTNYEQKPKKVRYFYENLKKDPQTIMEIRNKIILLAEEKWKKQASRKKEVLAQTIQQAPQKLSGTKSNIDVSKTFFTTDISGPKVSKNASCVIF